MVTWATKEIRNQRFFWHCRQWCSKKLFLEFGNLKIFYATLRACLFLCLMNENNCPTKCLCIYLMFYCLWTQIGNHWNLYYFRENSKFKCFCFEIWFVHQATYGCFPRDYKFTDLLSGHPQTKERPNRYEIRTQLQTQSWFIWKEHHSHLSMLLLSSIRQLQLFFPCTLIV